VDRYFDPPSYIEEEKEGEREGERKRKKIQRGIDVHGTLAKKRNKKRGNSS